MNQARSGPELGPGLGSGLNGSVRRLVLDRLRDWYGVDPQQVADDRPLAELGVSSRDAVALAAELSDAARISLPATLLWEAPTLEQLERRVRDAGAASQLGSQGSSVLAAVKTAATGTPRATVSAPASASASSQPRTTAPVPTIGAVEIAVVGIGCRLPGGVASPTDYWRLLREGRDAVGTLPEGRWDGFADPDDPVLKQITRHGGFLDDLAGFDAPFFAIAPSEAAAMDPQQRLLLEVARESLDHAAIPATALAGTRTGVFVGISGNEYARLTTADLDRVEAWTAPGAAMSIAANRLSYALDLRGPSLAVDTACSSSLVAVHHAVRALATGECDTALVGGVNVLLSPAVTLGFQRAGALASDGRCKTFDAAADGMVRAEGCAVVVLRRLIDAQRAGDRVLAVILSSAVNSDGRSNGLLAPSGEAQRALLTEVYAAPGAVAAAEVDYVEAHGTGTMLGDPVEAGALGSVLGRDRDPDQPLLIGSVKTNLGHLEAAAGIAGLAKTVLALHHGELPPQLHFTAPNPHIDFDELALRVVTEAEPWPRYSGTATAGVSAFGFGGTNAHVLVQEYRLDANPSCLSETDNMCPTGADNICPAETDNICLAKADNTCLSGADNTCLAETDNMCLSGADNMCPPGTDNNRPSETDSVIVAASTSTRAECGGLPAVLALDAPTPERLREDCADLAMWLHSTEGTEGTPGMHDTPGSPHSLADVAYTLAGRLGKGRHRVAAVARTADEAAEALSRFGAGRSHPALVTGTVRSASAEPVWVFSGYGSQWPGMGRRLLDEEPAFAAAVDRLEPSLRRHAGLSLRACLEPDADLTRPSVVQPVLFGIQVALAELWRAHGSRPGAVIGHSMGEIAAAVVSGAIDEEDGARIIAARSRLLEGLSGGAMAVVDRPAEEIADLARSLLPSLQVAVHASPRQCVVAGNEQDVGRLIALVTAEGGLARSLRVAAAGHTAQVDPLLQPLADLLGVIPNREPYCRMYTTVHGNPRSGPALDAAYWGRNLRAPVRFRQAVEAAAEDGHHTFIEISPHPTQIHPLAETLCAAGVEDALVLPTLCRDTDESSTFRLSLTALLLRGEADPVVVRGSLHPGARVADVPLVRWRHRHFWVDSPISVAEAGVPGTSVQTQSQLQPSRAVGTADRLRACIAEVTGHAADSIDDEIPLTGLGLDSLQAVRILALVRREFGVELPPRALLRAGTVASVADLLDQSSATALLVLDGSSAATSDGAEQQPERARGVLPRDATERLVARLWQSVSGEETADVDSHLRTLVSNPVQAEALANALGEELGRPVSIGDLLGSDPSPVTIATIGNRLRPMLETQAAGPLRTLRVRGERPPLFLIHPAGGSSAVYRSLARRLDDEQPCFGLERLPHHAEVTERAAEYADVIRALRPHGPWAVGGWSYGGVVAQETARLLQVHGPVGALVLIDSVLPLPSPGRSRRQEARRRFAAFAEYIRETYDSTLTLPYDELALLDDATQIEVIIKALQQAADLPPAVLEHQRDSYLDLRSGERHTPGRYLGRTLLYRATDPAPHTVRDTRYERDDESLGWDEYCSDLQVQHIPGHHLSLLDPPTVDVLAHLLDTDLGRAFR